MRTLPAALLAAWGLGFASPAGALSSEAGTSAAQFLKFGAGARAGAMGEAQAALVDDAYAAFYNPAGLALARRPMLAAAHDQRFQGTKYEYGSVVIPLGTGEGWPRHAMGVSLANLGVTGLERRTEDTDLRAGLFDASDYSYGLSYAYAPSERFSFGGTAKMVRSKIDVVSGNALAADVGVRYRLGTARPLDLALVDRNFGTGLRIGDAKDPLPHAIVAGAATELFPGLKIDLDLIKYRDSDLIAALGGEYSFTLMGSLKTALRAGYNNQRKDIDGTRGIALGAGLSAGHFGFDFSWVPFGDLGNSFRYSLLVKF